MKIEATSPDNYIEQLPDDRQAPMRKLRAIIKDNIPAGFEEAMSYGMIGYVVPHSLYPGGYHCDPKLPLPFINLASQKQYIALYHMGVYADPELLEWFLAAYVQQGVGKPDMGKSCIRFKKPENIPYGLIGELCRKMTPQAWIARYESALKNR